MKKFLYITTRIPAADQRGDQIRAFYQLIELSKSVKLTLICLTSETKNHDQTAKLESFGITVHCFYFPKWKQLFSLRYSLFTKIPFQVAYFYNKSIEKSIIEISKNDSFDVVHCHLIRSALYARKLKSPIQSIDYMDAYGFGMNLRYSNSTNFFKRLIFKSERNRLLDFETKTFDHFNQHFAISKQDALRIIHPKNEEIVVAANGVDFDQFYPKSTQKKYDLIFMGNMNYAPNVAAVTFIVSEILPKLRADLPEITLLIAGRGATKLVQSYQSERIDIVQNFDDISDAIASAKIMLAPMIISIGLQNKLLQAMAMNVPCITSDVANNAIGATPNEHLLTANSAEEFAHQTRLLLSNEKMQETISEAAFQFIHERFNWSTCTRQLLPEVL